MCIRDRYNRDTILEFLLCLAHFRRPGREAGRREDEEMNHSGTIRLETKRLVLRPFVIEDAPAMYRNWANDPQVTRFLTWTPHANVEDVYKRQTRRGPNALRGAVDEGGVRGKTRGG